MKKLEWIPLYLNRILGSKRWNAMADFQRGWYIQLLLECAANSERQGFLRSDSNLWSIAGAKRRDFWESHKSCVLACFKVREVDGEPWIFNQTLLDVIEEQTAKLNKTKQEPNFNPSLSFSVIEFDCLDKSIEELFEKYKQLFERKRNYSLTEKRRKLCAVRLTEQMTIDHGDLAAALGAAESAMRNLRNSEFHWENGYFDWIDHLFKNRETFEKRLTMKSPSAGWQRNGNVQQISSTQARSERIKRNTLGLCPDRLATGNAGDRPIRAPTLEGVFESLPAGDGDGSD